MPGLDGYVSPILRMSVFNRLNPGAFAEYEVVPMEEAFPATALGIEEGCPGAPTHAVVCTLTREDGGWFQAAKEIALFEKSKRTNRWEPVAQTPENLVKNSTKAMGRALTRAGIPQKDYELQTLLRWIVALDGRPLQQGAPAPRRQAEERVIDRSTGEIMDQPVAGDPDDIDDPDADDDTITASQALASRFSALPGVAKAQASKWAREELKVANIIRAPDGHIDAINTYLDQFEEEEPNE